MFSEHLVSSRHYSKGFTCVVLFYPYTSAMGKMGIIISIILILYLGI